MGLHNGVPLNASSGMSVGASLLSDPSAFTLLDLTTMTGSYLEVIRPDKSTATWTCSTLTATIFQANIQHAFQTGDLTVAGLYFCRPWGLFPVGPISGEPFYLPVVNP